MKNKNIVLVGLMGSGKSSLSKALAKRLKREVVSTDELIALLEGKTISDIFKEQGEDYFRKREEKVVKEVSEKTGIIIDCGGGVVVNPKNLKFLKATGILFYLQASPEFLYEKVKGSRHRPLLDTTDPLQKLRELLKERDPFYRQADYTITSEGRTIDDMCGEILKIIAYDG